MQNAVHRVHVVLELVGIITVVVVIFSTGDAMLLLNQRR